MINPGSPDRPARYRWEDTGWNGEPSPGARLLATAPASYLDGWHALEDRLLSRGGEAVVHGEDWEQDLFRILDRGDDVAGEIVLRPGNKSDCHSNVAALWRHKSGRIATGYALSGSMWRKHSWIVDSSSRIVETTIPREAYFGYFLDEEESVVFDRENNLGDPYGNQ